MAKVSISEFATALGPAGGKPIASSMLSVGPEASFSKPMGSRTLSVLISTDDAIFVGFRNSAVRHAIADNSSTQYAVNAGDELVLVESDSIGSVTRALRLLAALSDPGVTKQRLEALAKVKSEAEAAVASAEVARSAAESSRVATANASTALDAKRGEIAEANAKLAEREGAVAAGEANLKGREALQTSAEAQLASARRAHGEQQELATGALAQRSEALDVREAKIKELESAAEAKHLAAEAELAAAKRRASAIADAARAVAEV